jgi:hypothetical protein
VLASASGVLGASALNLFDNDGVNGGSTVPASVLTVPLGNPVSKSRLRGMTVSLGSGLTALEPDTSLIRTVEFEELPKLASSWLRRLGRLALVSFTEPEANARETYVDVSIDGDYINRRTYDVVTPLLIANVFGFDANETRLFVSWMVRNVSLIASRQGVRRCFDSNDSLYKLTMSRGHPSSLRLRL